MEFIIKGLYKKYDKKEVLKGIDFTFEEGKIYALLGRNGAGKTTLFNCINEDIDVDEGSFYFKDKELLPLKSEDVGYVLSTPEVPEFLTANEFMKFFLEVNEDKIEDLRSIDEYFEMVNIAKEDRNKLLKDFSHGMKNKMQMLVNIIARPKLLLLDEPLTSLDVVVAEEMIELLRKIKKDRVIILSTHLLDLALDLCDEIVLLHKGILEKIVKEDLEKDDFKDKIIEALRDE